MTKDTLLNMGTLDLHPALLVFLKAYSKVAASESTHSRSDKFSMPGARLDLLAM